MRKAPAAPAKLVLQPGADRPLLDALSHFPVRIQAGVLAAWLRDGYQLLQGREAVLQHVPAQRSAGGGTPLCGAAGAAPHAPAIRRVRVHDPGLAKSLARLGKRERGREIRRLIGVALQEFERRRTLQSGGSC